MVAADIQEGKNARAERLNGSADDVLREVMKLAFSDIRNLFTDEGTLLLPRGNGRHHSSTCTKH